MLHDLFEAALIKSSNAVAIIQDKNQELTYEQLFEHSTRLANYLRSQQKVKPGDCVIIAMPRDFNQLLVTLAVSICGAASVFIDPAVHPDGRVLDIFQNAQPTIILTTEKIKQKTFAGSVYEHVLCLDTENVKQQVAQQSTEKSELSVENPEDLIAYICYTSGSTGKPKGVPIKHSGLKYWSNILKEALKFDAQDRVLGFISTAFDAHIWEYIMAWVQGKPLCLLNEQGRRELGGGLVNFMVDNHVSHATLIPPQIRAILPDLKQLADSGLKVLFTTGEACTLEIVDALEGAGIELWNCYGPTELTFGLSMKEVSREKLRENIVPIGLPAGDCIKIKIIDEQDKEVSLDEKGELVVCSPYVTPGYLNNQEEFRRKTWMSDEGEQYYRTGDCFSQSDEGILYYHGRIDVDAVKINAVFVNCLEVEAQLREHPSIADVCVVFSEKIGRLICAVVLKPNVAELNQRDITQYLEGKISREAIPIKLLILPAFPIMPVSGKIDRKAVLANLEQYTQESREKQQVEQSVNKIEEKIINSLSALLGGTEIGLNTELAALGIDSIMHARFLAEINQEFKLQKSNRINYSELQECGTIEAVATLIRTKREPMIHANMAILLSGQNSELREEKLNLFLLPSITGDASSTYSHTVLFSALQEQLPHFCTYALDARILVDPYYEQDLSDLNIQANDFVKAILKIQPDGEYYLAGWSQGGLFAWLVAQELEAQGKTIKYLGLLDTVCPTLMNKLDFQKYNRKLNDLVTKLEDVFFKNSKQKLLPALGSSGEEKIELECLSKEEQIKKTFLPLLEQYRDDKHEVYLLHTYLALLENLNCLPGKLKVKPSIYAASETSSEWEGRTDLGWNGCTERTENIALGAKTNHFNLMNDETAAKTITNDIAECSKSNSPRADDKSNLLERAQETTAQLAALLHALSLTPNPSPKSNLSSSSSSSDSSPSKIYTSASAPGLFSSSSSSSSIRRTTSAQTISVLNDPSQVAFFQSSSYPPTTLPNSNHP